jgi:hypothetical protein
VFPEDAINKQLRGSYFAASIVIKKTSEAIGRIVAARKHVINKPKYPSSNAVIVETKKAG